MTDTAELRGLALGYAAAVDALDGEAFADLFTVDGELWVPDVRVGPEPTVRRSGTGQLQRVPSGLARYHATHHAIGPAAYAVDGAGATGDVAGVAHHLAATGGAAADVPGGGPGTDIVWYLRYDDRYRRDGGRWRIARRTLHLLRVEERSVDHVGPGR